MLFTRDYWKREWAALEKKERLYIRKKKEEKASAFQQKIAEKIPDKLESTLNTAFKKAFEIVFEKGTGVIEKTYDKAGHEQSFQVNAYAAGIRKNRKSVKAFSKQAGASRTKNLLISSVEGVGLGVLGIGIPDIPLFTAVVLKSIYEIALSYGFSYGTEEEQCFILKMIETAFLHGGRFEQANMELNAWMEQKERNCLEDVEGMGSGEDAEGMKDAEDMKEVEDMENTEGTEAMGCGKKEQISRTSDVLAEALLYMKFIQGIPVAGIVGGLADTVYLKKITDYVDLKYKRRFLRSRIRAGESSN